MKKINFIIEFVSNRLKKLRMEKGYTQAEVARMLNMESSTYQKMEKGETNTWSSKLLDILNLYKIDIPTFFEGLDGKNFNHQTISENEQPTIYQSNNIDVKSVECDLLRKQVDNLLKDKQLLIEDKKRLLEEKEFWKKKALSVDK